MYHPDGQLTQLVLAVFAYCPDAHVVQLVAATVDIFPTSQLPHRPFVAVMVGPESPFCVEYWDTELVPLFVPAAQSTHEFLSAEETRPGAHASHRNCASRAYPDGHSRHAAPFVVRICPAEHVRHAVLPGFG